MINSKVLRCFRRRCRLPIHISEAYIFDGMVFCSASCHDEWQKEAEAEASFVHRHFSGSSVFQHHVPRYVTH